ncbi:MAG TPA: hypothetical protein VFF75_04300, partial [Methylophilaceae bacterium]|nr:hypothetical protein [Methylophilaceae bacterium]
VACRREEQGDYLIATQCQRLEARLISILSRKSLHSGGFFLRLPFCNRQLNYFGMRHLFVTLHTQNRYRIETNLNGFI